MLCSCWHWWKLYRKMRSSDRATLSIYHLGNVLVISGSHRLIHFSNRCAPNITNPPRYCFFSLPPPPIIPSHLNAKTENNPNHQSIHPSLQGVFCFALFCDRGRGGGKGKWIIFAQADGALGSWAWFGALKGPGTVSVAALHVHCISRHSLMQLERWRPAFAAFAFVKYGLAWFPLGKDQQVGWGPGLSLACLAHGTFSW